MSSSYLVSNVLLMGRRGVPIVVVGFFVTALVLAWRTGRSEPPLPAVLSARTPRLSEQRCAECHAEIVESYHSSPHARTLTRVSEEFNANGFAGQTFRRDDLDVQFHYEFDDRKLMVRTPSYGRALPINWIFGSGTHAKTPLLTWLNDRGTVSAIEHGVSWYPDGQLGVTLGLDEQTAAAGIDALGHLRSAAETINCFGCHCTVVPVEEGRIQFDRIEAGVGCARCHWNGPQHVREMENSLPSTIEKFSQLTARESVDRCGECHRRADEMGGPIESEDPSIVRFASVGLVQSPCFLRQNEIILDDGKPARFDCVSCHDPHRPSPRDWHVHAAVCLKCHDSAHHRAADCPDAARDTNCLSCHMPQVSANKQMKFTDHWIRKRPAKRP